MRKNGFQDLLARVEKPSRYLGSEINAIHKDPSSAVLRIALAFPDLYEIGTSHFGMQILYHVLNSHPQVYAERFFAPAPDLENILRERHRPLFSLETKTPLDQFDIIGFSLLYELNYTNVLGILQRGHIPWRSAQRDERHPLVIAGGPCTCNPEPVSDFFDAVVVGEGEDVVLEMAAAWLKRKPSSINKRNSLLSAWGELEGVYIPRFFPVKVDTNGFQRPVSRSERPAPVKRAVVGDLESSPFPEAPVLPYGKPIHDRLRIEVSRGCTRGCRFCQAGMIYRPIRERSPGKLLALAEGGVQSTGYEDVSLLSLSTGDYSCITPLMESFMERFQEKHVAVSLPSLRAGTLTPGLMEQIRRVRKTGFTIAPEAGSQRLRDVINKNITEDQIFQTVEDAFRLGWQAVKLYFMIGLPTETEEDINAMVDLVFRLKKQLPKGRRNGQLKVSVATFIPKPHTPFQWCRQISLEASRETIRQLKDRLHRPGIHFKWQNPSVSWLEGLWARGDRRLSRLLEVAYDQGCRFDGWSDQFRFESWEKAISMASIDPQFFLHRERTLDEPLPWDHIDVRVDKAYLWREYQKALAGRKTEDCRQGDCSGCGVCDFIKIQPVLAENGLSAQEPSVGDHPRKPEDFTRTCLVISKLDTARFFGHLETVNILLRAIHRAGVPLRYSDGFHPKAKIQFEDPLPIGMESRCEKVYFYIPKDMIPGQIGDRIDRQLPDGLNVLQCFTAPPEQKGGMPHRVSYMIQGDSGIFAKERLEWFDQQETWVITRKNLKGTVQRFELKEMIIEARWLNPKSVRLILRESDGPRLRPKEVIRALFQLGEEDLARLRIEKTDVENDHTARSTTAEKNGEICIAN